MITFSRVSHVCSVIPLIGLIALAHLVQIAFIKITEFYVYIPLFSLCVFPLSCKCPKFLFTRKQRTDLSLFLCPFVDVGADICLPSGTVLQPCGAVHLLFWHPGSYFPWLWQNSVPVECNFFWLFFLFLLYVSFFTIYSKKNIWTPDFSSHYLRNTCLVV